MINIGKLRKDKDLSLRSKTAARPDGFCVTRHAPCCANNTG